MKAARVSKASSILDKKKIHQFDGYARPERRAFQRFPSSFQARLFYGNMIYTGIIVNLSKNGMFVSTQVRFPVNSEFLAIVMVNNRSLKLPVKVVRSVDKQNDCSSGRDRGIGVRLLDIPQSYLDHVGTCRSSLRLSY